MIEFVVLYKLPSGWWTTYRTTDRAEANAVAASEEARTGWPHKVVPV